MLIFLWGVLDPQLADDGDHYIPYDQAMENPDVRTLPPSMLLEAEKARKKKGEEGTPFALTQQTARLAIN